MLPVTASEYIEMLEVSWKTKLPLMTYGGPGVGKSECPRELAPKLAKELDRTLVEWAHLSEADKKDAIRNAEKYFIFCDQRIGGMDSTDLRGLPKFSEDWLVTTPYSWIGYFTTPGAAGIIFLDEINLAPPTVAGQAYELILTRTIADRRLADDVLVIAAGNRASDKAFTFEMPAPLRDRFNEIELRPDVKSWTEWAGRNNVNPHLISFVNWKEMYLYTLDKVKNGEKGSSPRSIVRASTLIGDHDITSNIVRKYLTASCGTAFAVEFQAYVKHYKSLNWNKIFKDPSSVSGFSVDKCWAIAGGLVEHFNKKDDLFDTLMDVLAHMRDDFAIVALKLLISSDVKKFRALANKSKNFPTIVSKYGKYVI